MSPRPLPPLVLALCACATATEAPVDAGRDVASARDTPAVTPTDVAAQQDVPASKDVPVTPPTDAGGCRPDRDGVITRAEFPATVGATALYFVNRDGATVDGVNTAGVVVEGVRRWDYSARRPEDQPSLDEVLSPRGRWWSGSYADATFASVIDRTTNALGVYRLSDTALELLGTVSTEENRTNMRFTPPVAVLRFPLREGDRWEQTVAGAGTFNFTPLVNSTVYVTRVDASGEVWTPAARFPVLRVNTTLDQTIPLTVIRRTRRTYAFVTECGGLVARVGSVDNDLTENFTRASEFRRLGL
jgi:hypothetical protein